MTLVTSANVGMSGKRRIGVRNATLPCGARPGKPRLTSACPRRLYDALTILLAGLFFAGLLMAGLAARAEAAPQLSGKLRLLSTAHQVHSLSREEAMRAYPVHIQGVVTYFDQNSGDGSGAMFV